MEHKCTFRECVREGESVCSEGCDGTIEELDSDFVKHNARDINHTESNETANQ